MKPIDLAQISERASHHWQRHNATAGMPRVRGTAFPSYRNEHNRGASGNKSPEFEYDAQSVSEELGTFEHRLGTAQEPKTNYKYPNVELKRCFEPKQFRQSNADIRRMLST